MGNSRAKEFFINIFPPPKFLEMRAAGFDISDKRIRFLRLVKGSGGFVVENYGEVKVPEGFIVSGTLKKPEEVHSIISSFEDKHGLEFVRVSLPEERAYLVKMETPAVGGADLPGSIAFQLEEYVPIPAEEAVFDYKVIKKSVERPGYLDVAVSVIPRNEVKAYLEMFAGTSIVPVSLEIEAQAIARAVIPRGDRGTYIIIDFGKERTGISVVSDELVRFNSTVDVGSEMITQALQKSFSINAAEAEIMKNERMISKSNEDKDFFDAVMSSIAILRDEINKLYIYWHTQDEERKEKKVEKIILTGGGANLRGLSDYLSASLRLNVEIGNPWRNVNSFDRYIPPIPFNEALGYTPVIGLALKAVEEYPYEHLAP